jgi:hypothetical protein
LNCAYLFRKRNGGYSSHIELKTAINGKCIFTGGGGFVQLIGFQEGIDRSLAGAKLGLL